MKAFFLTLVAVILAYSKMLACDVCQNNQPKVLKNITHGTGPQDNWDYIIVYAAAVIVSVTLFLSIKFLVKPKENVPNHVKNIVIDKM